jgi:Flp pilus assembly pilin Flp
MLKKLWNDDAGIVALEYLLVATIIGLGLTVGLHAVSVALNIELTELANAITAISQEYSFCGQAGCCSLVEGSGVTDSPSSQTYVSVPVTETSIDIVCTGTP